MPLDKKSLSFLHHLQTAYAPDKSSTQNLNQYLPYWIEQYKKTFQSLFEYIKKEKAHSKLVKSFLAGFSDELRIRLSDQLPEKDLLKILTEAFFLSYILKEEWQNLIHHAHLSSLSRVIQELRSLHKENPVLTSLQKITKEISSYLPAEIQKPVWLHLYHIHQYHAVYPFFSQKVSAQLISFLNYLLKRKLGSSLNDEDTQMLWLNTIENHWEQSLIGFIEPDLQENALAERMVSCKISFMEFGLAYPAYLQQNQSISDLKKPLYWQDPLHSQEQGIQTNLFSSVKEEENTISDRLRVKRFSCIGLDIRQPLHPYRYARRSVQGMDQQIHNVYQSLDLQANSISHRERMLHWSLEKLGEQGILLVIMERKTIEVPESQSFRKFLKHAFQEIYVLDIAEQEQEGLAVLYLVRKSGTHQANIQYARLSFQEWLNEGQKYFESLNWQKVKADQQNYWIALPESDFFALYPLFGTAQAIFKSNVKGIQSFLDEWLMDDDPKLLEKKVRYFLKQYSRASQKSIEEPDSDIKWPEILMKMARSGQSLSFDKQKIKKIQIRPFVFTFMYAEENLLLHSDASIPSILYDSSLKQVFPLNLVWHTHLFDDFFAFPLISHKSLEKTEENISDAALKSFRAHYQKLTKDFDQTFIVFPPENISTTLDKIESVSRDLPVIRKYPNQISRLLEEARHFTSDVELLTPPYEKIDEFRRKVLRLEKDAIERKVIYQKVKAYIEELKEQLATLTHEHDEAQKDYEAVNKENIFYYTYAVLQDPNYRQKYGVFLQRELPRIPMLPKFRQWVQWGKALFHAHQIDAEPESTSSGIQVKEEIQEKPLSKTLTYTLDKERGILELKEQKLQITLSNIPKEVWKYQFMGRSPLLHYLDYLSNKTIRNKKIKKQFTQPHLSNKPQIIAYIKHLCSRSIQLATLEKEMQKVHS